MESRGTDGARTERWRRAAVAGAVLAAALVVPSPLGRHPEFSRVGPDKLLHLLGHAGFAAALADALVSSSRDRTAAGVLAVAGSVAIGLVATALQRWVPGRVPERADAVAGLLGSVLGGWWLVRRRER